MSKYKGHPHTRFEISLNETENDIYLLFCDFAKNIKHIEPESMLLNIAYSFLDIHLSSLAPKLFTKEGKEARKIHLKSISKKFF